MSIFIIQGPAMSGKSTIANALRNDAIAKGRGALLVDEKTDGEVIPLMEKIIDGVNLRPCAPADQQAWKKDPCVVLVGNRLGMLDKFEEMAPGFRERLGPIYVVRTGGIGSGA
jgi:hypothetical protein